jgi:DNA-binding MarR family transcriptional regulator
MLTYERYLHNTVPHHTKDLSRLMPVLRHATTHLGVEQTPTGKSLGLTNARIMALTAVGAVDACSMSDLAQRLELPAPLATRVTDELVARHLVERCGDPDDRRRVVLRLTEQGRTALDTIHGEAERLVSAVLLRMTEAETEALLVGLQAFLHVLHAPASDGAPPALPAHDHGFPTERNE